jgi:NTE family protein
MVSKYPFRNLVFKGGGVKAFAYLGAVEFLERHNVLSQIERVAGNSAGSIMATMLSFGLDAQSTGELFDTLDYSKVTSTVEEEEVIGESRLPRVLQEGHERLVGGVSALNRLREKFGLYSSDYLHGWLEEVIASQSHGDGRATFADFRKLGFLDLYIVATNITAHTVTVFSAKTTPNAAVADAAIASSSIPLLFESPQFDGDTFGRGDYYADGGVMANYPLRIFDDLAFEENSRYYQNGVNWETVGCRLYTPEDCRPEQEQITNLIGFLENLLESLAEGETHAHETSFIDRVRTINISNCCVSTTDFSVRPGSSKYNELIAAGRVATQEYLENYKLPMDRFAEVRARLGGFFDR